MATVTQSTSSAVTPYRLTVRQFLRMIEAGVFPEGVHVELLGGILVDKMTKHTPHNFAVDQLSDVLRQLVPVGWIVREEKSAVLGRYWRPEPDLAVIRGPRERYRKHDPRPADMALFIEVADTSYRTDHGIKWQRYAQVGVPVYWIVNLPKRAVEVYTAPSGRGKAAAYRDLATFGPDQTIPVIVDRREVGRVAVNEILP